MSFSDPLGDMLTRIRNAQMRGMDKGVTPASKLRARVLEVLQGEGYIRGCAEIEKDGHKHLEIELKYCGCKRKIKKRNKGSVFEFN